MIFTPSSPIVRKLTCKANAWLKYVYTSKFIIDLAILVRKIGINTIASKLHHSKVSQQYTLNLTTMLNISESFSFIS